MSAKIFVANLANNVIFWNDIKVNEIDLESIFGKYGKINQITIK